MSLLQCVSLLILFDLIALDVTAVISYLLDISVMCYPLDVTDAMCYPLDVKLPS